MARTVSTPRARGRARTALDRRFDQLRPALPLAQRPREGWIRTLREALGMSAAELGRRMEVGPNAVIKLEAGERANRITLGSLERAAEALGCDLVYVMVPRQSLDEMVDRQAASVVGATLAAVGHTMLLEDQQVSGAVSDEQFGEQVREVRDQPGLWADVY
ncbi:mobile mystery protein A [Angustibacter sp. McL0619]|uniref:mobile mystery protein A n=1 Tax=Angustibacter sp. McL0619 TaxID=3415676 RepID=UPI003CF899A6